MSLAATGCVAATEPGETIEPTERADVGKKGLPPIGKRSDRPTLPASGGNRSGNGSIEITVLSTRRVGVPGVVLRYEGPQDGRVTTGSDGVARATLPKGRYSMVIQPCGRSSHIVAGLGDAEFTVEPGTVTQGTFDGVGAEPRYQPIEQSRAPMPPPWKVGVPFTVQVRIGDRCSDGAPVAKSLSFADWEIVVRDPMQLAKQPTMRSDAEGWLSVQAVCNDTGDGEIAIRDRRLGTRYVSFLAGITAPPEAYCER